MREQRRSWRASESVGARVLGYSCKGGSGCRREGGREGGGLKHLVGGEGLVGLAHLLVVERDLEADVGRDLHDEGKGEG